MITITFSCDKCKKEVVQSSEQRHSNISPLTQVKIDSYELGLCKACMNMFWTWLDIGVQGQSGFKP
jgi:uncharacterized protein with PIN domain